jgi:hypothetical protein
MLGIQIWIRLNLDLFGRLRILQGALAVCSAIFYAHSQIGIRVVANPPDLRSLIFHPQYGSTAQHTVALKRTIFKQKKGFTDQA